VGQGREHRQQAHQRAGGDGGREAAFRGAFRKRRALVPADGFYEWRKREGGGPKQPLLIRRRDGQPFAFAGLWEHWRGPEGEVETCTILTTEANACSRRSTTGCR
jgi:putative SOS response-associated peptidase YedK